MTADFLDLGLDARLVEVLTGIGFIAPTLVQKAVIPLLLAGRDVVVQADTGTGKTAAYVLPILQRIDLDRRQPQALVLCPTRELSAQVAREFRRFGKQHRGLRVLRLVGGEPRGQQMNALNEGAHILVATPGRALDHLTRRDLQMGTLRTVILDEADRMLDMGFADELGAILEQTPNGRQMAFFSATYPETIASWRAHYQQNPESIVLTTAAVRAPLCEQLVLKTEADTKLHALRWVLKNRAHQAALVFTNFKASAASFQRALAADGFSVDALHGDLQQVDRDRVLAKFRNGSTRVLVATDVAARGIDIAELDLVINAELPNQPEVYVHRVGRTGRAGKPGVAISIATSRDDVKLAAIEATLGRRLEPITQSESPPSQTDAAPAQVPMDTLRIFGGRKDKVRPGDILGALTGEAGGLAGSDVGKIEIYDTFSYVAVSRSQSRLALKSLGAGRIKGKRFRVVLEK